LSLAADNIFIMTEPSYPAAFSPANQQLASEVWRFEQLVSEHSDRLRRIELLLEEIAADDNRAENRG
jgi:hypothetical protein